MGRNRRIDRPRLLAAIFGPCFVIVAILAWLSSANLSRPEYGPAQSQWLYTVYTLTAAAFLVGLAVVAFSIQESLGTRVRRVNRELGHLLLDDGTGPTLKQLLEAPSEDGQDLDMEGLELSMVLETLGEVQNERILMVPPRATTQVALASHRLQLTLLDKRDELQRHERLLTRFIPGPMVAAVGIFAVSVAVLPSTGGFLQTSYQLNAAIIHGVAYGWIVLAAYFAASILGIVQYLRKETVPSARPATARSRASPGRREREA